MSRLLSYFRIHARSKTAGYVLSYQYSCGSVGYIEVLRIKIYGHKLNSMYFGSHHSLYRFIASASNANYLYACESFKRWFNLGHNIVILRFLPVSLVYHKRPMRATSAHVSYLWITLTYGMKFLSHFPTLFKAPEEKGIEKRDPDVCTRSEPHRTNPTATAKAGS